MASKDPHEEAEGGRWLRPASPMECRFEAGHRNHCLLVSNCLTFSTARPITEQQARTAVTALYRTAPNLRVCLGYREGQMWLREMAKEKIDFQMIENGNVQQVYESMYDKKYNTASGPLWASRLIPCRPSLPETDFPESVKVFTRDDVEQDKSHNTSNDAVWYGKEEADRTDKKVDDGNNKENDLPSVARSNGSCSNGGGNSISSGKYPHKYHFLLGFHHLITDGYTCVRLYGLLLKILNSIIDGQQVDDQSQVASLVDVTNELKIMEKIERMLNSHSFSIYGTAIQYGEENLKRPLILDAYPAPSDEIWRTANLIHHLEEDTTISFISRCKREGVTFHSGFTRVIGAATVQMLKAADVHKESYEIGNVHVVDHRRYNGNVNNSFGSCIGYINSSEPFTKFPLEKFWEGAKKQDAYLRAKISSKTSLENDVINRMVRPANFNIDKHFETPPFPSSYFTTSNMLDVTNIIGDCGEHVRVDWLHGGTSNHRSGNICVHIFQTLRGRLQYGINYSTQHLHTNTARALGQTVFRVLNRVIRLLRWSIL